MRFIPNLTAAEWRRPSVIALILANLVPVGGVLFFSWEVFPVMFLFWSENVIIGAFNVLRMMFAMPFQIGVLPLIPFFCVHYGLFTFVHGVFVIELFGGSLKLRGGFPGPETFWEIMRENHLSWAVLGLVVSRGISFATNYVGQGEFRRITPGQLMGQPYGRIVVLHIAILGGGFLVQALHSPVFGLLLLVALKILLDLAGHVHERSKFSVKDTVKVD
ncbi:MAG: DUF6498-containing protein [Verrucomicrobiota bacterium]